MKRMLTLAILAAFILGFGASAGAVELKVQGQFQVHGEWIDNVGNAGADTFLNKSQSASYHGGAGQKSDAFHVEQRLRTTFNFIASENLKAVWGVEIGTNFWGQAGSSASTAVQSGTAGTPPTALNNVGRSSGFGTDGDGVNIETRWAYLDFKVPGSTVNVKVGLQPLISPSAFNGSSAIMDIDAPALVVSTPFNDMVALSVGWTRLRDKYTGSTTQAGSSGWDPVNTRAHDEADFFFAAIPFTPKGMNFTPFFMYGLAGKDAGDASVGYFGLNMPTGAGTSVNSFPTTSSLHNVAGDSTKVWWAGGALEMTMFDPIALYADFNYGNESNGGANVARRGWLADAMVQYKGLSFGTPTVFGMYSTGENDNGADRRSERMPFIQTFWAPSGSFFYSGTNFDSWQADIGGNSENTQGTWCVGAGLYGLSLVDKLTHDLIVLYIRGTNSDSSVPLLNATQNSVGFGQSLTKGDSLWEIDFNHQYQIYEQLSAILELGFIKPNFDEGLWGISGTSNAWRAMFGFKYKF